MTHVVRAHSLWHEDLKRLSEQRASIVPEKCLGLLVDQHDDACVVDDNPRVRGGLKQLLKYDIYDVFVEQRNSDETFLAVVRRIGIAPFKERVYAATH